MISWLRAAHSQFSEGEIEPDPDSEIDPGPDSEADQDSDSGCELPMAIGYIGKKGD